MPRKNSKTSSAPAGPQKGEFIAPPDEESSDALATPEALPQEEEFWRPPVRFGSIPVEREPLGWDRRRGFRKLFPAVMLPTQVVERISFGHRELEPNRLFWGDNLHVMRQLPSESIDLIYIDPPFFSGRQYNVIFGDQNELRSFSDIWEGGMPGYLIWLNARLYEMKRLLKKTGSIYVHLDWHASHYVKIEMDKVLGHDNFRTEIIWEKIRVKKAQSKDFPRVHDAILCYSKTESYVYSPQMTEISEKYKASHYGAVEPKTGKRYRLVTLLQGGQGPARRFGDKIIEPPPGKHWIWGQDRIDEAMKSGIIAFTSSGRPNYKRYLEESEETGIPVGDIWNDIAPVNAQSNDRIGYPTQKPEELLERIILASTSKGDIVADFFSGGGTTAAVAQRLSRRWITCDQSRVAVAITADRLTRQVEEQTGRLFPVPDFTIEHWGVYEAERLSKAPPEQFRQFVLRAFGATPDDSQAGIHGMKGAVPVWVGEPDQKKAVTAADVQAFANAMRKTLRYKQDNLRDGIMLAWAFRRDAREAADRLRELEQTDLNFVRMEQVRINSPRFREQVAALSTAYADYENFLTFVQPPKVEVGWKRIAVRTCKFDVSETAILNAGAKIINVQWDFDYGKRFSSTPGYSFIRGKNKEPALQTQYEFPKNGTFRIACKVQDDMGGEGLWTGEIEVK